MSVKDIESFDVSRSKQISVYLDTMKQKKFLDCIHRNKDDSCQIEEFGDLSISEKSSFHPNQMFNNELNSNAESKNNSEIYSNEKIKKYEQLNRNSKIGHRFRQSKIQNSTIKKTINFLEVQLNVRRFISRLFQRNPFIRRTNHLNYKKFTLINDNSAICEDQRDFKQFIKKSLVQKESSYVCKFIQKIICQAKLQQEEEFDDIRYFNSKTVKKMHNLFESIPTIQPDSAFLLGWNIVNSLLKITLVFLYSFHQFFFMPLYNCTNNYIFYILYVFLFILLLGDVIINFNKVYIQQGVFIFEKKAIFLHYLTHDFIPDVLGIVPLVVTIISPIKCVLHLNFSLTFFLNFLIYLMIYNFYDSINELEKQLAINIKRKMVINLSKLIFLVILLAHFTGCALKFIADYENDILRIERNWIKFYHLEAEIWYVQYIYSFYWACTTMITVGFGDITAQTPLEVVFIIICMMLGCGMFGFSINQIGVIIQEIKKATLDQEFESEILTSYLHKKNIPKELTQRSLIYLQYIHKISDINRKVQEKEIVSKLSPLLQKEINDIINSNIMSQFQVLHSNFSKQTLDKVQNSLIEQIYTPGEIIYYQDSSDRYLYLLQDGEVDFFAMPTNIDRLIEEKIQVEFSSNGSLKINQRHREIKLSTLNKGQTFGELAFFTGQQNESMAKSSTFSVVYKISRKDFIEILKQNSEDFEKFCYIKECLKWNKNYRKIHKQCDGCNLVTNHLAIDCPFMHFVLQRDFVAERDSRLCQQRAIGRLIKRAKLEALSQKKIINECAEAIQEKLILERAKSEQSSGFTIRGVSGDEPQSIDQQNILCEDGTIFGENQEDYTLTKQFVIPKSDDQQDGIEMMRKGSSSPRKQSQQDAIRKETFHRHTIKSIVQIKVDNSVNDENEIFALRKNNLMNVSYNVDTPANFTYFFPSDNRIEKIKIYNKIQKVLMRRQNDYLQIDLQSLKQDSASRIRTVTQHFILKKKIE